MRLLMAVLITAFFALQYKLWLGDGNLFEWYALEKKLTAQKKENEKLVARNRALQADILQLKSGEQALEERARYELGMIKDGEIYYHFIE